jgi:PKD repeat protein
LTPIRAVWDFDNSNGIQEEAAGTRVMNVYTQPGDYEATVTISDATGASPATKTYVMLVRVK